MSRRVINCAKQCLSHPFSRIKWIDQWAVEPDPVLTSTTSAKIGEDSNKGVTRASFGRRAPRTPQLKRGTARRREVEEYRGVYMVQQVAAVRLDWGQAPSLDTENDI